MLGLLFQWLLYAIALLIVSKIVPGFQVDGLWPAMIAAVVIGLLNATVGFFLKIITFPLSILTLGIFLLVINGLMILLTLLSMVFVVLVLNRLVWRRLYGLASTRYKLES